MVNKGLALLHEICMCVCVCVRAHAHACLRARMCVLVCLWRGDERETRENGRCMKDGKCFLLGSSWFMDVIVGSIGIFYI